MGKIALAVASSGIAAELLSGGWTAHSHFKIPIPVSDESVCAISLQSTDAQLMCMTTMIVWDEVLMSSVQHIEGVDRILRDILKCDIPFGGLTVVFGGDPCQILPVVRRGDHAKIVQACVLCSCLWQKVHQVQLKQNMHVPVEEIEFSKFLLEIGEGHFPVQPEIGEDVIHVPEPFLVSGVPQLIEAVFPHITKGYSDKYFVANRAILAPKNEHVDMINNKVMELFPGEGRIYTSADSVGEEGLDNTYPVEFLNFLNLSGLPPHSMQLKVNCPVILLRNLRAGPGNGLHNGTQMIIKYLGNCIIEAEICSGVNKGTCVLLPCITLVPSDTDFPFTLKWCQFPVQPCFTMTTNKAQGQTLHFVGLFLQEDVFSHGQLYVALSRVCKVSCVAVLPASCDGFTRNIVYHEVL